MRSHRRWTVGEGGDRSKHLLSISRASGTVLRTVNLSFYSVVTTNPGSEGFYLPHFTDEKAGMCSGSGLIRLCKHGSWEGMEMGGASPCPLELGAPPRFTLQARWQGRFHSLSCPVFPDSALVGRASKLGRSQSQVVCQS